MKQQAIVKISFKDNPWPIILSIQYVIRNFTSMNIYVHGSTRRRNHAGKLVFNKYCQRTLLSQKSISAMVVKSLNKVRLEFSQNKWCTRSRYLSCLPLMFFSQVFAILVYSSFLELKTRFEHLYDYRLRKDQKFVTVYKGIRHIHVFEFLLCPLLIL